MAACSSDTSRFSQNPFSNPFAASDRYEPTVTGSIPQRPAPVSSGIQAQPLPPLASAPQATAPVLSSPGLSSPVASAAQPRYAAPATPVRPQVAATGPAGWSAQGGTNLVVAQGETVSVLANRYGVPASAILSANGLTNASQVQPGQRLTIPVYNAAGSVASASAARAAQPALTPNPRVAAAPAVRTPAPKVPAAQPLKAAEVKPVAAKPAAVAAPQKVAAIPAAPVAASPVPAPAAPQPKAVEAPKAAVVPAAVAPTPKAEAEPADQTASIARDGTEFRWPARGRIIAGFNGKGGNEGINIALPEGTPVKAAEGGTVAYAGNELKGYGNLVLIRHDNGFVSAYAHNGEISVKRGDKVRRGQVIAKSGQTGNVNSPQLHFELRKGSTPVDPIQHLTGL